MKRIYDFSRNPARRNHTIADLQALKSSGRKLSMSNPADNEQIRACVEAGIDLFVVGTEQMEDVRRIAPTHFTGAGSTWAQFGSNDEILAHAFEAMRRGADMYYTLRSFDAMEMLAKEGIPVQSHIGLIPTFSHYCGGLRAWGRNSDEAMKVFQTLKRMEDVGVFAVEVECLCGRGSGGGEPADQHRHFLARLRAPWRRDLFVRRGCLRRGQRRGHAAEARLRLW